MSDNTQQYKSVLKSTSLIGGSAFINILIGMIRTKFVAVLLGPTIKSNLISFYNIFEASRHSYDNNATRVQQLVYECSSSVYDSSKKVTETLLSSREPLSMSEK